MTHEDKIQEALRRGDFYELALLTYEGVNNNNNQERK